MGIYIKGMQMPKNCHSCPMCLMRFCQAGDRELSEQETRPNAKRPEDCPLVPVPEPHGRLIDANALEQEAQKRLLLCEKYGNQFQKPYEILRAISETPTIIEAEAEP